MTSSLPIKDQCFHEESSQLVNFSDMSNICFIVRLFPVFLMESKKISEYSTPMKIDASNVEVINILFKNDFLLLSRFASSEDWSYQEWKSDEMLER